MTTNFSYPIFPGVPEPYGISYQTLEGLDERMDEKKGKNFAIFSEQAESVTLCLFSNEPTLPEFKISLDPQYHKSGHVWHIMIMDLPDSYNYAYQIQKKDHPVTEDLLLDPYAKLLVSPKNWGEKESYTPLASTKIQFDFDWQDVPSPKFLKKDLVIYEMHVRGFTSHESSQISHRGTFLGLIEKIPYLLDLGVNAVELLPIHEFNENEYQAKNPVTQQPLYNYWGYSTVSFFSPMNRYASGQEPESAILELKTLVRELHRHGIEVILDVVFNHTAEGNEDGPTYSFKGIDHATYYHLSPEGQYSNYSGCGNTLNANNPIVINLIISSLRWYVTEFHIDGFRFDLASIFNRDQNGMPIANAPLLEAMLYDPVLAETKLIAEAWDAAGLYQVGSFYPKSPRWSEWNGQYRDNLRRFIKGNASEKNVMATRICGSQDLFHQNSPATSINFITSHDGFSLADLVSYNEKQNLENGEDNRDGLNQNESWNCGVEGITEDLAILNLRQRQMKNFHLALLVSQGIPMLLMGDEYGHTRKGNNNCWCQDNELNWFLWNELEKNLSFYRFYKALIHFRKMHECLHQDIFLGNEQVVWHGATPLQPEWHDDLAFLSFTIIDINNREDLHLVFNSSALSMEITLPEPPSGKHWKWIVNTANEAPQDFFDHPVDVIEMNFSLQPYSAILLKAMA